MFNAHTRYHITAHLAQHSTSVYPKAAQTKARDLVVMPARQMGQRSMRSLQPLQMMWPQLRNVSRPEARHTAHCAASATSLRAA